MEIITTQTEQGFTSYCPKAGCGREFTKPTKTSSEQAARMHYGRSHARRIKSPMSGHGLVKFKKDQAKVAVEVPAKRRYTKRVPLAKSRAVNFCPDCGCNLAHVAMGMVLGNNAS